MSHNSTLTLAERPVHQPYRWVACSTTEFGPSGERRHLARKGDLTTYCGFSATHPEIWRGNSRKPQCSTCAAAEASLTQPTRQTGSPR